MTLTLKTIEAFPRGRTTEELFALLDVDFDPVRRDAISRELAELQARGTIALGRDRKWRLARRAGPPDDPPRSPAAPGSGPSGAGMVAVPAQFLTLPTGPSVDYGEESDGRPDPSALLRYYRSALQSDPRGALTQTSELHGKTFQLVTGSGTLFPGPEDETVARIALEILPPDLREALSRRDGEENGLALGWPLAVTRNLGVPVVRPVGLIAATWERRDGQLDIRIAADDVVANPDWLKGAARASGWTLESLAELLSGPGGMGLAGAEFAERLSEAAATAVRGRIAGSRFAAELAPDDEGIHDALALFLPSGSTFTAGAVRDLDRLAAMPRDRLSGTALAPLLGLEPEGTATPGPALNTEPLNMEQIEAVRLAMSVPLTAVTGPPGTGKSQAIVAMAATALWNGQRVIVASRNHQALDAVEERLGALAPEVAFLVRTLDPATERDIGMAAALDEIVRNQAEAPLTEDPEAGAALDRLGRDRAAAIATIEDRRALHLELADLIERLELRTTPADGDTRAPSRREPWRPLWRRLLNLLLRRTSSREDVQKTLLEGLSADTLRRRIGETRARLAALPDPADPVGLTEEIATLVRAALPRRLLRTAYLDQDARQALSNAHADHVLQGDRQIGRDLAVQVVVHRPLWLTSVLGTPRRIPLHLGLFDLAIFDEASQCDIGSALPVLARARRAVIVGDDRQLAFIPQLGVAQDRNLMAAQGLTTRGMGRFAQGRRSLFDLALSTSGIQAVMLRDQYRSAADIVDYINGNFYGGKLRVAADQGGFMVPPGARPGLAWTHVPPPSDSAAARNVNQAEVAAVAGHVAALVEQGYRGSIGVISPFRSQVEALARALGARVSEERHAAVDLRVATVDGFQGQERDLILFSPVVHARAAASAVTFLQRDWRRLNVAISRARAVAHVFGDLDYARSGAIRTLASLAARATEPRRPAAEGVFDSKWERIFFEALKARGLDPEPQKEIAGRRLDFALYGEGGVKLDLEIDGRRWHQDIDGNRKPDDFWRDHQMRSLGWKVRRFWVDELKRDMEGCLDIVERDLA